MYREIGRLGWWCISSLQEKKFSRELAAAAVVYLMHFSFATKIELRNVSVL